MTCTGLLLPGEHKSVESMVVRLAPANLRRMRQPLHHVVADAPWSDKVGLDQVRDHVLPAMVNASPMVTWIVLCDDLKRKQEFGLGHFENCGWR